MNDYVAAVTTDINELHDTHRQAWADIWASGVWISGNLALAQAVNASFYFVVSSIRDDWPWSLSPGTLAF